MVAATQELQSFYQFAERRLRSGASDQTLDDLYLEWRASNPAPGDLDANVRAVRAAIRDMDNGETGRPIDDFLADFRRQNGI